MQNSCGVAEWLSWCLPGIAGTIAITFYTAGCSKLASQSITTIVRHWVGFQLIHKLKILLLMMCFDIQANISDLFSLFFQLVILLDFFSNI